MEGARGYLITLIHESAMVGSFERLKNDDFFIDFGVFSPTGRGVIKLNTSTVQIPNKEYIYYSDSL